MRNPAIWETSNRPLFVRSVWLETSTAGGGRARGALQRHFILDYEPHKQERQLKSAATPPKHTRENLQRSISWEYSDPDESFQSNQFESNENLLVGSGKVKLHHPSQQQVKAQHKCRRAHRRSSIFSKKHYSYHYFRHACYRDYHSRRSSLQDVQSSLSNANSSPDERLAERVLNWLDLAGKSDIARSQKMSHAMEAAQQKRSKALHPSGSSAPQNKRRNCQSMRSREAPRRNSHMRRDTTAQKVNHQGSHGPATGVRAASPAACRHSLYDSVKHITIIFNRDGIPVRFNRPARNIDLCALSASPGTTRRMAGTLASARLYKASGGTMASARRPQASTAAVNGSARRCFGGVEESHKPTPLDTGAHDSTVCSNFCDARKQLHIFMPSLPKKSSLLGTTTDGPGTEDSTSVLSNTFTELCKM